MGFLGVWVMDKRYEGWSTSRKYATAIDRVESGQWSQSEAARRLGISRTNLNKKLKEKREADASRYRRDAERSEKAEAEEKPAEEPALEELDTPVIIAEPSERVPVDPQVGPYNPHALDTQSRRFPETLQEFVDTYLTEWTCPDCAVTHRVPDFHEEMWRALDDHTIPRLLINVPPFHRLDVDTPILTTDGWSTMGALKVGDRVFAPDGSPTVIVGVSETVTAPAFEVVFGTGESIVADAEHRWFVDRKKAKPTWTTTAGLQPKYHRVSVAAPLQGGGDLPVDPYTLGLWLGDGATDAARITTGDRELLDLVPYERGKTDTGLTVSFLGLQSDLKAAGVFGNKHIPDAYFVASEADRLELLRGLMDSDGTVNSNRAGAVASFSNTNRRLAEDVKSLIAGLGWLPRTYESRAVLDGVDHGPVWTVTFLPSADRSPFRLDRKSEALPESRRNGTRHVVKEVVPVGDRPGRCITVAHPSEMFLAGRAMIPTGNSKSTVVTVWDTVRKLARNPNLRIGIISAQAEFASAFLNSIRRMLEDPELYARSKRNLIDDWGPFIPEGRGGWAANSITVAKREGAEKDPSVIAQGFGSHIYGRRFDEIKYDDVATLANQRNPETVAKMIHSIETEHLNRVGKTGRVIWVGTRVNPGDIYSVFGQRPAYKVIRYPAILNEQSQEVLWPEHVPFSYLETLRGEMDPVTFQLVYQNVEMPGLHASFTQEMLDNCKDTTRSLGHYESTWKLVAGLDPAGGGEWAGYTSFTLLAIDLATSRRYLVDQVAVKSMKAPQILQQMRDWTEQYPISKWVVEANGLQGQLFQYNVELVQWLAARGVQLVPHVTGAHNKWDQQFGVETIAPLMHQGLVSIPWGTAPTAAKVQPTIDEFVQFPMGQTTDRVMSWWFAELGIREYMRAMATPMFDERRRVPARVRKRRHVVSFGKGRIDPMPDPRRGAVYSGMTQDRFEVGRPLPPGEVSPWQPDEEEEKVANVDLDAIWGGRR